NTSTTQPSEASITTTFTNGGTINTPSGVTGDYYLWILGKDTSGNTLIQRSNVFKLDNTPPVITVTGTNPITINAGTTYSDAGATASDAHSGLNGSVTTTGTVNPNVPGTYTLTYSVSDKAGNAAVAKTRTVKVVDTTKPTVTFGTNGNSTYAKSRSTTVTVSDNVGVNTSSLKYLWNTSTSTPSESSITTSFTNGGTINTPSNVTGDYYLWILAKDTTGNTTIQRTSVFKLDNIKPVITLNGSANMMISKGSIYTDPGSTASDAHSGLDGNVTVTGTVNTSVAGTYTLTYTAKDKAGNTATATRTVNVIDTCFIFDSSTGTITGYSDDAFCPWNVVIPSEIGGVRITSIGDSAFYDEGFTSVVIPNSITSIGDCAFMYNQLTSVTIPSSVTSIGDSAFSDNKLTSVTIPSSVTSIGDSAFSYNKLTSVTIPSSVTSIGDSAFSYNKLTSVTIQNGVTSIGSSAFSRNQLTSVTIPNSVTNIGDYAFYKYKSSLSSSNPNLTTIINKTGRSFEWGYIIKGSPGYSFVTGTVTNGDVIIKSN
ncbi:MAG TPA: leucine-rich repeat protein, partial [Mollicutes bacterium]|nr:leucine-rich repeat protein [Mollicutes bacterium]